MPRTAARPAAFPWVIFTVTATLLALMGTAFLWSRYGTVVFFETIRAGFAACFG
jgi:formate hydrogenlyase subunit 3/multisubunit Na+/H+ antiporter MnhD subunit